jgi:hypothetical protein
VTPFDSFRAARWIRTLNLVLQAVLFTTFFLGLNYLARNHAQSLRKDLTQHRRYSLSPETLSWIRHLPQPVNIVVTFTDEANDPEVRGLLKEYVNATDANPAGRITVTYLDPFLNRREAERLGIEKAGVLLLLCDDRRHALTVSELYRLNPKDKTPAAFLGEQAITNALLDVSSPTKPQVLFLTGHGELRPDDVAPVRGLSTLRNELAIRNLAVDTLDLTASRKIPADALLVAVAPQTRFAPAEQELLRQFLSAHAGRLILCLAPGIGVDALGLDDLLLDWGVLVDDDRIFDTDLKSVTDDGDLVIWAFDKTHPITQTLVTNQIPLRLGKTRSVRPDPGRTIGGGLTVTALAGTSATAWGERDYRSGRLPRFDPGVDIRPIPGMEPKDSLGVALASERLNARDKAAFSVPGGRLVVFGTGDFVANHRIAAAGALPIFFGAVNWTLDRDRQLNVPPRPIERFQLSLSAGELQRLRYSLLFALPGAAALLGLIVYWTRRS